MFSCCAPPMNLIQVSPIRCSGFLVGGVKLRQASTTKESLQVSIESARRLCVEELSKISHFLHAPLERKKSLTLARARSSGFSRFCCNGVRVTISGGTCAAWAFLAIVWEIILQDRGGHCDQQHYEKGCQERRGFIRARPPAETSSLAGHRVICRRREVRTCLHR